LASYTSWRSERKALATINPRFDISASILKIAAVSSTVVALAPATLQAKKNNTPARFVDFRAADTPLIACT